MTKEEYNAKEAEIKEKIRTLKDELKTAQEEYVRSNSPIPTGTKVRTNKGQIGILKGYKLDFFDKIVPVINKIKKDGTESKCEIPCYYFDSIEPIE